MEQIKLFKTPRFVFLSIMILTVGAWCLGKVELTITAENKAILEAHPYTSEKVPATWTVDGQTWDVMVSYRGAYALQNLILYEGVSQRNWKIKTAKEFPYQGYREWNFNFQEHIREKLALDLYAAARVPAMPAKFVDFYINGEFSGVFLEFPDPDNKEWLKATFGSAAGDLYKASTDIPGDTAHFGETTKLGAEDSSYYKHYQKKTNNDSIDSLDYSSIRGFLDWVNISSDEEFANKLESRFDVNAFLRYLVVSNFAGHWDGYPNRGKNYWLYLNPLNGIWSFIPWDVDATFQNPSYCLNNMGKSAGLFFMNWPANYCESDGETKSRPLFERIMSVEKWHNRYVGEYQTALTTYLEKESLLKKADSLSALIAGSVPEGTAKLLFESSVSSLKTFVEARTTKVDSMLDVFPTYEPTAIRILVAPRMYRSSFLGWVDLKGQQYTDNEMEYAPQGIYWRGSERRIIRKAP